MLRHLAPLIAVCTVVSSCYVATHYSGWQYQGGRIINNGLFSRPRYEAPMSTIPFNVPGTYEYSFNRFPADDAYVIVATPSAPPAGSIEQLTTKVHIRVIDQKNNVLCDATGFPSGKGSQQLIVTSSADVIGLWHTGCAALDLRACAPCRLSIAVGPVDPRTPAIALTPTLRGGGLELP